MHSKIADFDRQNRGGVMEWTRDSQPVCRQTLISLYSSRTVC